jgi:hypothetical protein
MNTNDYGIYVITRKPLLTSKQSVFFYLGHFSNILGMPSTQFELVSDVRGLNWEF